MSSPVKLFNSDLLKIPRRIYHGHHLHSLILKENFHAQDDDFCQHCDKAILCSSFVYTCNTKHEDCAFKLHKYCALPITYMHPKHEHILNLVSFEPRFSAFCHSCHESISNGYSCRQFYCFFSMCLKCAVPSREDGSGLGTIQHWSHQHPLRLLQRYATFECDGCNKVATDFSYLCDKCSFWIHQSCAFLPRFELFGAHHKHPLRLSDSLPQVYRKFPQFCKICNLKVNPTRWLYYCANCRFFAHIHCALSKTQVLSIQRDEDDDPELIHLPAPDELLMNSMMQKCIKDIISLKGHDTDKEPPPYRYHWAHEHRLTLKNKSALITADDDLNPEISTRLITCRGCSKPISTSPHDADVFYECNQCNFFLHRYCAQFPEMIHNQLERFFIGFHGSFFLCNACHVYSYGFGMEMFELPEKASVDVWCACLPLKIKHQAHHHPIKQINVGIFETLGKDFGICKACRCRIDQYSEPIFFGCGSCDFYIHRNCAFRPGTMTHRWDPHALHLVLSLEDDIEDHPHEFQCEFCSEEIDTNTWFYHCNVCDLSFHPGDCITACSSHVKVWHSNKDYGSPVTRATVKFLDE